MRVTVIALTVLFLTACGDSYNSTSGSSEVQGESFFAGLVTATIARGVRDGDICYDGYAIDERDVIFGEWVRERASYTNVCFQVWKPGVTDVENPEFASILDVRAIYRYDGDRSQISNFVDSIGRSGNNRRYAFDIRPLDRLQYAPDPALRQMTVELVFAIRDNTTGKEYVLRRPNDQPFKIIFKR